MQIINEPRLLAWLKEKNKKEEIFAAKLCTVERCPVIEKKPNQVYNLNSPTEEDVVFRNAIFIFIRHARMSWSVLIVVGKLW